MTILQSAFLFVGTLLPGQEPSTTTVDYVREVKPILTAHCYACHGAIKQKGGLRLDTVAAMKEGGDQGASFVAGKAEQSLLLKHVLGEKGFKRMPPENDGEALKPAQVAILRRWIEQGGAAPKDDKPEADPREHWAFRSPVRPDVPKVVNARHPIDAFIAAERDKRGLTPQGPAERGVLLRRVHLDLVGLPPTRAEMQAFLADTSPDAYEKVVDRLLTSPQHGERWGRHWMDIWRYSDWWGLGAELRNSQKHIWHWRDWIVESLNKDKGYDRMLLEMLAADELTPTDQDAMRATGFLARHYFKFNRTTWLDETIEHTGKAFLGLTLNCCKCHDHKYDPFSQADYYRFRAIFEPYMVRLDAVPGEIDLDKNGMPRAYDAHLTMPTYLHIRGNEYAPDKNRKIVPGLPSLLLPGGLDVRPIKLPPEAHSPGLRAHVLRDHLAVAEKQLAAGRDELAKAKIRLTLAEKKPNVVAPPSKAKELLRDDFMALTDQRWEIVGGDWKIDNGKVVQTKTGAVRGVLRLRQEPPADFEARVKFATLGGETYRSVGISFDVDNDHETLVYLTPHAPARVQVSYKNAGKHEYPKDGAQLHKIVLNQTNEIVLRVRGPLLNVSVNGQSPLVYRLPIARRPGKVDLVTYDASARFEEFVLTTLPSDTTMVEGVAKKDTPMTEAQARAAIKIAEKKIAHAAATLAALNARSAAQHPDAEKKLAGVAALAEKKQAFALAEWNLARVEGGAADLKLNAVQANAAVEAARKALTNPGETFTPITASLKAFESPTETDAQRRLPYPRESSGRRSALAQWITDRKNPLTARVAVNHLWTRHFGQPLVASVFDFGRKGAAPTHPELLDWLAVELMEGPSPPAPLPKGEGSNRWSMKHIHRLLVTSQAYQMSSSSHGATARNLKDDPDNRSYWRMNPQRMESQAVRDSLLHLAGELDLTLGGPTVDMPQQETSKRRSLYFFHSSIERNKFLATFDEADPLDCYRRRESIVPQQALALSNSALAVNLATKIAGRLNKSLAAGSNKDYARESFTWMLGYAPSVNELAACEQALERWMELNKSRPDAAARARAQLIQALLNHNDFITIR